MVILYGLIKNSTPQKNRFFSQGLKKLKENTKKSLSVCQLILWIFQAEISEGKNFYTLQEEPSKQLNPKWSKLAAYKHKDAKQQLRPIYKVSTQMNLYLNKEVEKHVKTLIPWRGSA